jgi:hypothetical protein
LSWDKNPPAGSPSLVFAEVEVAVFASCLDETEANVNDNVAIADKPMKTNNLVFIMFLVCE